MRARPWGRFWALQMLCPAASGLFDAAAPCSRAGCSVVVAASALPGTAGFAIDLVAARPVKPCDGGVFGAFYLLLKTEHSGAWRVRLAFCGPSVNRLEGPAGRFGGKRLFRPFFAASHAPQASPVSLLL